MKPILRYSFTLKCWFAYGDGIYVCSRTSPKPLCMLMAKQACDNWNEKKMEQELREKLELTVV